MKTAQFVNFTDQEFIGYWNGKGRKYPAGTSEYMPDYLAQHFAKHLTNRELLRTDGNGNLIHKGGDKMTSPKKPEDVPIFMELFNKAYIADDIDEIGDDADDLNSLIGAANKNRTARLNQARPAAPISSAKVENAPPLNHPREVKPQEDMNYSNDTGTAESTVIIPPDFDDQDE